jgi:hypothetical protein
MLLPVYVDKPNCFNKEVVSVGTNLNFYYIHDSFIPFLFILPVGGILRRHMSVSMLYATVLVFIPLGIKERNSNSENRSNATTKKY